MPLSGVIRRLFSSTKPRSSCLVQHHLDGKGAALLGTHLALPNFASRVLPERISAVKPVLNIFTPQALSEICFSRQIRIVIG